MLTLLRYAWLDLRHDWTRAAVTALGLAVLVFSYHLLISLSHSFAAFSRLPAGGRNLIVIQNEVIDPSDAELDPAAVEAARALPADLAARVSPVMFRTLRVADHLVHLRAAPLEDWQPLYRLSLREGRWPSAADEIAAGDGAARANGWSVGSRVRVYGTDFTISAILSASGTYFASLWLPLDRARELYGAQASYQAMYVQPAPGADGEALRLALLDLPVIQGRYAVFYEDSYTQRNNQATRDIDALAKIAAALAMLAVVLGVYTATRLSMTERSRELGCLFALGFSTRSVRLFLLARAQILAAAAYLAGLAAAWGYETLRGTGDLIILGFTLRFEISSGQALAGFAWMVLLSALGVWLSLRGLASSGAGSLLRGETA